MSRFAIYDEEDVEAFKSKIRAKRTQESANFAINILNEYCGSDYCVGVTEFIVKCTEQPAKQILFVC